MPRYGHYDSDDSDFDFLCGDYSDLADVWDEQEIEYPDDDTILSRYSPDTARRIRRDITGQYTKERKIRTKSKRRA